MSETMETLSAVALFDFAASAPDELNIRKGEVVMVLEEYDDGWWLVGTEADDVGVVPSNYLEPVTKNTGGNPEMESAGADSINDESDLKKLNPEATTSKIPIRTNPSQSSSNGAAVDDGAPADYPIVAPVRSDSRSLNRKKHTRSSNSKNDNGSNVARDISLDQVSLDRLTEEISKRLNQELSTREKKLIEHVREMINQSTAPLVGLQEESKRFPSLVDESQTKQSHTEQLHRRNDQYQSKIPVRVSLPRLVDASGAGPSAHAGQQQFSGAPRRRPSIADVKLPIFLNQDKMNQDMLNQERMAHQAQLAVDDNSSLASNVGVDGIHYPQCRSVVYGPTHAAQGVAAQAQAPPSTLSLHHIYGYDGDFNRHGSSIKGKNVLWVDNERIIYPAAAVVVVQSVVDCRQSFFCGHSEDVTCVSVHPNKEFAASGQLGKDSWIYVWDVAGISKGSSTTRNTAKLKPTPGVRGISGICFSGDGKFIIATGIDESHSLMVFDWKEGTLIANAKVGHVDVNQAVFNPYLYSALEPPHVDMGESPYKGQAVAPVASVAAGGIGSYTIVSFGGKQVKFWVLKVVSSADGSALEDISSFKGRKLNQKKGTGISIKYSLEGNLGALPNKASVMPEVTSYFITNDSPQSMKAGAPLSRVFFGTAEGSVYIWQQLADRSGSAGRGATSNTVCWLPRGRLISVVTELHDAAIVDMHFVSTPCGGSSDQNGNEILIEKVLSASVDGIINVWQLNRDQQSDSLPLEHLGSLSLDNEFARSMSWNTDGSSAVIGTVANSVMLLSYEEVETPAWNEGGEEQGVSVQVNITAKVLNQSHDGKVRKLAVHPVLSYILASISSDKTVRVWATNKLCQCSCLALADVATAVSFSSDGRNLAIGNDKGELYIFESEELENMLNRVEDDRNGRPDIETLKAARWRIKTRKSVVINKSENAAAGGGKKKSQHAKRCEVVEIKFCPNGSAVAVGCKDNLIHILSITNGYKHQAVCRGHSSWIKNIDFSTDGTVLQSSDAARELLHWDVQTGQRITNAAAFRDVLWSTVSCVYGWSVTGVFNGADGRPSAEGDINCVCRSVDGLWLVAGGSYTPHNAVKLFNYPCLSDAIPSYHGGHTSPVLDVAFLIGEDTALSVATAGGNDCCLFQWRLTEA